jgi:hypothetical protein
MTRGGVREYLEAVQGRYLKGTRREKGQVLDEFTRVTGYHRKAAIRLLSRSYKGGEKRRGRAKQYGLEAVAALKAAWGASDRMCSKRLQPFLPELVQPRIRHPWRWFQARWGACGGPWRIDWHAVIAAGSTPVAPTRPRPRLHALPHQ